MHTVERIIEAPNARVWSIIVDTQLWPEWGPSVKQVDYDARWIFSGARGRLQTPIGIWLPFVITTFEDHHYWGWKVAGIRATGHRLESLGPCRCKLSFEIPYGAFFYAAICKQAMEKISFLATAEPCEKLFIDNAPPG